MTTSGIFAIVGGLALLAIIGATVRALITDGYGRRPTTRTGLAALREQQEGPGRDSLREPAANLAPARASEAPVVHRAQSFSAAEPGERRRAVRSGSSPSDSPASESFPAREPKRALVSSAPSAASSSAASGR